MSGSVKPHRGLSFFYPKNEIPTGVLGIQGVGKCKTPPGSVVFLSKKWNPHRGLGHSGCQEVQNPTGVCRFFIQKIESPPGSGVFIVNYPTSWILADNFSLLLLAFPKSFG